VTTSVLANPADLEPTLLYERTYATRRRVTYVDAAVLLSLMFVLLGVLPARLIVPGATDLGRPSLLLGFMLFLWWVITRFGSSLAMQGPQPIRWAFFGWLAVLLVGYAVGFLRGLTSIEANAADRSILYFCVFGGAVLTAADGLQNWVRLRSLLKALVYTATFVAAFGVVEYVMNRDLSYLLLVPGLQEKGWTPTLEDRGAGARVASTTGHYIELAAYLALVLPFALHFAIHARRPRERTVSIICAVVIAAGIASTISRTGMVAMAIMFLALVPVWTWRMRYNIGVMIAGVLAAGMGAKPGLFNTLFHLFDNPTGNSSISVRYERYPMAFKYIAERPWLGRGTGTWVSPQYQVMDNEWLDILLNNGFVGAIGYAALHITAITVAWMALKRSNEPEVRHLCAALIATQFMGLIVAATFDSLGYLTYATTLGLTIGLCGTVWRLTHPARMVRTSATRPLAEALR
jgi:O-antigen ligase